MSHERGRAHLPARRARSLPVRPRAPGHDRPVERLTFDVARNRALLLCPKEAERQLLGASEALSLPLLRLHAGELRCPDPWSGAWDERLRISRASSPRRVRSASGFVEPVGLASESAPFSESFVRFAGDTRGRAKRRWRRFRAEEEFCYAGEADPGDRAKGLRFAPVRRALAAPGRSPRAVRRTPRRAVAPCAPWPLHRRSRPTMRTIRRRRPQWVMLGCARPRP